MGNLSAYDITKLNILVLEKHVLVRKLLTEVFTEFGVPNVQSTPDPNVAWNMFSDFPTDIILSDWTHGLDGMAFLRKVRRSDDTPNPFVPIIVVTANTELHHVCEARDTGMTEFLAKPVSARLLYTRIVSILENNRPFIRAAQFFGPDRRRRSVHFMQADRRQSNVA